MHYYILFDAYIWGAIMGTSTSTADGTTPSVSNQVPEQGGSQIAGLPNGEDNELVDDLDTQNASGDVKQDPLYQAAEQAISSGNINELYKCFGLEHTSTGLHCAVLTGETGERYLNFRDDSTKPISPGGTDLLKHAMMKSSLEAIAILLIAGVDPFKPVNTDSSEPFLTTLLALEGVAWSFKEQFVQFLMQGFFQQWLAPQLENENSPERDTLYLFEHILKRVVKFQVNLYQDWKIRLGEWILNWFSKVREADSSLEEQPLFIACCQELYQYLCYVGWGEDKGDNLHRLQAVRAVLLKEIGGIRDVTDRRHRRLSRWLPRLESAIAKHKEQVMKDTRQQVAVLSDAIEALQACNALQEARIQTQDAEILVLKGWLDERSKLIDGLMLRLSGVETIVRQLQTPPSPDSDSEVLRGPLVGLKQRRTISSVAALFKSRRGSDDSRVTTPSLVQDDTQTEKPTP